MVKLLLALGIILEINLTDKFDKNNITEYYYNFYNPIVWLICIITYTIAVIKFIYEGLKDIFADIKEDSFSDIKEVYLDFKQYEKYKKENNNAKR